MQFARKETKILMCVVIVKIELFALGGYQDEFGLSAVKCYNEKKI